MLFNKQSFETLVCSAHRATLGKSTKQQHLSIAGSGGAYSPFTALTSSYYCTRHVMQAIYAS